AAPAPTTSASGPSRSPCPVVAPAARWPATPCSASPPWSARAPRSSPSSRATRSSSSESGGVAMSKQPKQQGGHPAEVIMYPAPPIQRPAGRAGAASCPPGHDPEGAMQPALLGSGMTWYDVLGVMPGAEARKIKQKYDAKAALLRPELISGAPPDVLTAVTRAQELLDT